MNSPITIFHGDDPVASRQALRETLEAEEKRRQLEVIRFDRNFDLTDIIQAVEAPAMLINERLIIIERLFSLRSNQNGMAIQKYLAAQKFSEPVYLWEENQLQQKQLAVFPRATIKLFKLPVVVFKWLDSILPGNEPESARLLTECLKTEAAEKVFFLLARQVRLLLTLDDEKLPIPQWQRQKLGQQRQRWGWSRIIWLHRRLTEIDEATKTGQNILTLKDELVRLVAQLTGYTFTAKTDTIFSSQAALVL
ncbi:hypothetical protein A3A66_01550 [Microgenomates group bacterium RIFCSPLOWO2_01_FULL_46_13]|nr:MAG: hypothetical protein A2783_00855 [Microgenomates group bacterium RIFCSPHIGHO2_01_FULL_45_11]OGV94681.1 MAG: hypothetical protein A3A66_01550 [Microgenomates group bacterium RIFCSPLOWO2_01_FULL_46_13]